MMTLQSKTLREVMKASEHFWELNVTDDRITAILNYLKRVENIYKPLLVLIILSFGVKPFLIKGSSIFNCYISPEIPYAVYYVLECYGLVIGASVFIFVNLCLCSFIISVVVQFRLLNIKIKNLNLGSAEEDYDLDRFLRELKSIIQHQQFLMRSVYPFYFNTFPLNVLGRCISSVFGFGTSFDSQLLNWKVFGPVNLCRSYVFI